MTVIPVLLLMLLMSIPARASVNYTPEQIDAENSLTPDFMPDSWYPEVIEYVYVNDTVSRTVEYSITTHEMLTETGWTVDGKPVDSTGDGKSYYHAQTWTNANRGFHSVDFRGWNNGSLLEFRWYVNVHEIGGTADGSIFDVIDDSLETHAIEIKILMFRYGLSNEDDRYGFAAGKVRQMMDEMSALQASRDNLRMEFKSGKVSFEEYAAAVKQARKENRFYAKLSKELANIMRNELNIEELAGEFENFSMTVEKD